MWICPQGLADIPWTKGVHSLSYQKGGWRERLRSGNEGKRRVMGLSRKGHLQHDMLYWACLLRLVARLGVCKILKQGQGSGLVYRTGFSNGTEDMSETTGKKMISLAALFSGRKSLLKTKREKPTPVETGDDLEKQLDHENKRQGTRSEIVQSCPENHFKRSEDPEKEKQFFK